MLSCRYIPETQETIKAHPQFMVFATQNPAGLYGGRKVLSRAFRNRFVELHFGDIPTLELVCRQPRADRWVSLPHFCLPRPRRLTPPVASLTTRAHTHTHTHTRIHM